MTYFEDVTDISLEEVGVLNSAAKKAICISGSSDPQECLNI